MPHYHAYISDLHDDVADAAGMSKQKAKKRPKKAANKEQVGGSDGAEPREALPAPKGKKRKVVYCEDGVSTFVCFCCPIALTIQTLRCSSISICSMHNVLVQAHSRKIGL